MVHSPLTVGVLALQGAFFKHIEMLRQAGAIAVEVRKPQDLIKCDGLIIPGGESTTISKLLSFIGLRDPIKEFSRSKPIFGTCAGLIVMSHEILGNLANEVSSQSLDLLNITVERNAYGRQTESFQDEIQISLKSNVSTSFPAIFIRAPRIKHVNKEIKVLAEYKGEPVFIQQGFHLGATFHPELSNRKLLHSYFLKLIQSA